MRGLSPTPDLAWPDETPTDRVTSSRSQTVPTSGPPTGPPGAFRVTAPASRIIVRPPVTLTWTASPQATSYAVHRYEAWRNVSKELGTVEGRLTFTDPEGLACWCSVEYIVEARNGFGFWKTGVNVSFR